MSELSFNNHVTHLPVAYSGVRPTVSLRRKSTDFIVQETLSFEPSGEGEHLFLYVEKTDCNTDWVGRQLQKYFKLRSQDIGYAGKKDRHSISSQWFSLHLPGKNCEQELVDKITEGAPIDPSFKIIKSTRHHKKLRKGSIKCNHFQLILRDPSGPVSLAVLEQLKINGFPDYFGYQRFGHNAGNLDKAELLLTDKIKVRSRNKRGLYLSAARSYLFNLILAERVSDGSWDRAIDGDCLNLAGSRSYFYCEKVDSDIIQRMKQNDLQVSGWLPGKQKSQSTAQALAFEEKATQACPLWLQGLSKAGVDSARRSMKVIPQNFEFHEAENNQLHMSFSLPAGSFATSLLREMFIIKDESLPQSRADNIAEMSGDINGINQDNRTSEKGV